MKINKIQVFILVCSLGLFEVQNGAISVSQYTDHVAGIAKTEIEREAIPAIIDPIK